MSRDRFIAGLVRMPHDPTPTLLRVVCRRHGVSEAEMRAKGKKYRKVAYARWEWFSMLRNGGMTIPKIAEATGFDTSTIIKGIRRRKELFG